MTVVKEGKTIINQQDVTCPKCEAILNIILKDLEPTPKHGIYFYVCPCCGRRHSITDNELNDDIKFGLGLIK